MTGALATRDDVRRALEGAPARPSSPVAASLAGWRREGLELCATCAGRILERFFACGALRGWDSVWSPESVRCCGCGIDGRADR